jgi:hypothetical protein
MHRRSSKPGDPRDAGKSAAQRIADPEVPSTLDVGYAFGYIRASCASPQRIRTASSLPIALLREAPAWFNHGLLEEWCFLQAMAFRRPTLGLGLALVVIATAFQPPVLRPSSRPSSCRLVGQEGWGLGRARCLGAMRAQPLVEGDRRGLRWRLKRIRAAGAGETGCPGG